MTDHLLAPQPGPVHGPDSRHVQQWVTDRVPTDVLPLVLRRHLQGLERYGVPLRTHDGRNSVADLVQELVDAVAYAGKLAMESGAAEDVETFHLAVALLRRVVRRAL